MPDIIRGVCCRLSKVLQSPAQLLTVKWTLRLALLLHLDLLAQNGGDLALHECPRYHRVGQWTAIAAGAVHLVAQSILAFDALATAGEAELVVIHRGALHKVRVLQALLAQGALERSILGSRRSCCRCGIRGGTAARSSAETTAAGRTAAAGQWCAASAATLTSTAAGSRIHGSTAAIAAGWTITAGRTAIAGYRIWRHGGGTNGSIASATRTGTAARSAAGTTQLSTTATGSAQLATGCIRAGSSAATATKAAGHHRLAGIRAAYFGAGNGGAGHVTGSGRTTS